MDYQNLITDFITKNGSEPARIRSTNIKVSDVLESVESGVPDADVLNKYKIKREQLYACILYRANENSELKSQPLEDILISLETKSEHLNVGGVLLLLVSICLAIALFWEIKNTTERHIDHFTGNASNYTLLIYLIVRSSALSVIATTVLIFTVKTAIACFDQSARFAKRRNGALFLKYLYNKFDKDKLDDKDTVGQIIKFFEAWNQNIESAFTTVKVDKSKTGSMEINLNKDGAMVKTDDREK